ncbi:UDP-N-acetylmuramoylalanyl-D-glutamate--2,6-diaminopimelate ligase [Campylobacter fetus subsp. testudinum]|uniref:UDP-N-acetylmuramoyl-L-alanyl-D-glutamate--2,6-diaminopimelate ligase n=1 Tax=Campylobacter fetus subsp. testudinum TaxID=1507806 RepID=A0AAX0HA79_CAMFE|nr:UDP-N-acetylmuramoyl-L-alanyl-D-glutamate--2,6-diaminopimelate ligase [Campylobacter fetus]OCR90464.1 UDP-N-acetylmuramoylalanyl-D-glutamate--2,6-diaminopimelate ligase [Campylobacter fetus subsp. testudinum]
MKILLNDGNFITDNSTMCESGCFFLKSNSNSKFENDAIKSGAIIITPKRAKTLLNLDDGIQLIGITGTNGKTTTAFAIAFGLRSLGYKVGVSGTRGAFISDKQIADKGLTTSQILETLSYIKQAKESGCRYFVMEVSSHAIAQNRIEGLDFALKVFTNLSQDHLDYHKSFSEYARVKSSFFDDGLPKLINGDDESIKFNYKNSMIYWLKNSDASFFVENYDLKGGIKAVIKSKNETANLQSNLQGRFNLYNLLAAIGSIKFLSGVSLQEAADSVRKFESVAGRVEIVSTNPLVIVDFAHTPDGIEKVLDALSHDELVVVFGAGGDRDKTKRPIMGKIVQKYASISIVTSDNPRTEDPNLIITDILAGMQINNSVFSIENRKDAIKKAIELAGGKTVVVLGKGDEPYQEINGKKYPFSDKLVVQEILNQNKELKCK